MTNWIYQGIEITSLEQIEEIVGYVPYGFIYNIVAEEGREYVGQKQLVSKRSRVIGKRELLKEGKSKFRKKKDKKKGGWKYYEEVFKESNWKIYTGSSKPLNEDIKKGIKYTKYILEFVKEKTVMNYKEAKQIISTGAMEDERFYNNYVQLKVFKKNIINHL